MKLGSLKPTVFSFLCFVIILLLSEWEYTQQEEIKPKGEKKKKELKKPEPPPSDIREEKLRWVKEMEEESEKDAGFELLEESERKKRLW